MFSLFNPWIIIGALCVFTGVYFYGHHSGYQERVTEDQIEMARLNDLARTKEVELNNKISAQRLALGKAKDEVNKSRTFLTAKLNAGELRLTSDCSIQASTDAPNGARTSPSESERKTIEALADITKDGDTAIIERNACIAQYNEVRKTLNDKP